MRLVLVCLSLVAAAGCHRDETRMCPALSCRVSCPGGTVEDDDTGCPSCICNGDPADAGTDCPARSCGDTCGLGNAADPTTGCPTCSCCNPADCEPGGCHGTGADGCPTCYACLMQ